MGLEDEVERFPDAVQLFALDRQRQSAPQADAQEDRVDTCRAAAGISPAVTRRPNSIGMPIRRIISISASANSVEIL